MTERDDGKISKDARKIVFRLLKVRHRSCQEIIVKLQHKMIPDHIIKDTIKYFKGLELIDDRQFARSWISSRLKKPYGSNRIRCELKNKGIDPETIEREVRGLTETRDYSEIEILENLARKRAIKYKGLDLEKRKARLYGYLLRRGFNTHNIVKVITAL